MSARAVPERTIDNGAHVGNLRGLVWVFLLECFHGSSVTISGVEHSCALPLGDLPVPSIE